MSVTQLTDPRRLEALRATGLLDTEPEPGFDRLTRLAAQLLDAPVAIVSLVEAERQFFKSCFGVVEPWASRRGTPLTHSFCQHCVLSAQPFVVEDATAHPLVQDNPAVSELEVVAYVGVPLFNSDGIALGTLCVIDSKPHAWTDDDISKLQDLAGAVMTEMRERALTRTLRSRQHRSVPARPASAQPAAGGLNISALARRTGVAPDTLRKWEQRYGILRPTRTAGGQRRYGELDVARVEWLRARLAEGYRIGEAAALLGSGEGDVGRTPEELRRALVSAVERADAEALGRLLDQAFTVGPLESALASVVAPLLEEVGARWESGEFSVAQEHLVTACVRARLERLLADTRTGVRGVAVLTCAPGERHELGLLMLAVLLRADGWQVAYLGADAPVPDAVELARRIGAHVLCVSAALADRIPELAAALEETDLPPGLELIAGGAAITPETATRLGARFVDGHLRGAVRAMRSLVR